MLDREVGLVVKDRVGEAHLAGRVREAGEEPDDGPVGGHQLDLELGDVGRGRRVGPLNVELEVDVADREPLGDLERGLDDGRRDRSAGRGRRRDRPGDVVRGEGQLDGRVGQAAAAEGVQAGVLVRVDGIVADGRPDVRREDELVGAAELLEREADAERAGIAGRHGIRGRIDHARRAHDPQDVILGEGASGPCRGRT